MLATTPRTMARRVTRCRSAAGTGATDCAWETSAWDSPASEDFGLENFMMYDSSDVMVESMDDGVKSRKHPEQEGKPGLYSRSVANSKRFPLVFGWRMTAQGLRDPRAAPSKISWEP